MDKCPVVVTSLNNHLESPNVKTCPGWGFSSTHTKLRVPDSLELKVEVTLKTRRFQGHKYTRMVNDTLFQYTIVIAKIVSAKRSHSCIRPGGH
ncbi:hypothetical protein AVEN_27699-1 [Araneus ventricosus]|uniref:Uncharacterized protein n=1 Tax=Araneus ventricosus TaxID=182803 RepID=A0A4Y2XCG6_ARAVE|nr:hypothetical protein AVEN_27699-1 [Araneus ventricosus]